MAAVSCVAAKLRLRPSMFNPMNVSGTQHAGGTAVWRDITSAGSMKSTVRGQPTASPRYNTLPAGNQLAQNSGIVH